MWLSDQASLQAIGGDSLKDVPLVIFNTDAM